MLPKVVGNSALGQRALTPHVIRPATVYTSSTQTLSHLSVHSTLSIFSGFFALKASATLTFLSHVKDMQERPGVKLWRTGAVGIYRIWNCKSVFLSFYLHFISLALSFLNYSVPFYPSVLDLFSCAPLASPFYAVPVQFEPLYLTLRSSYPTSFPRRSLLRVIAVRHRSSFYFLVSF